MNVVLLHDWLTGFRGGERVLEVFCELFPEAPLYTLLHIPGSTSALIEQRQIHTSFLNKVPGIGRHYRKFLPFFPCAVESMRIHEKADVVLSSSHCVIKGLKHPEGAKHISYVHSPMRYMYDQFDSYFGPHAPALQRFGAKLFRPYLTRWDIQSNRNVDVMVANSAFVAERIQRYYGVHSGVIHPFVELSDFKGVQARPPAKQDYYAMVSAFAPNKRVDLAIQACNRLGRKLKIVGTGQEEKRLRSMAGPTVEFLGNVDREGVIQLLSKARAFLFPGVEDFGITPLESLASGTPVIAYRAGGVLETLHDGVAVFFNAPTADSLVQAIQELESAGTGRFHSQDLFARAQDFSRERFKEQISRLVVDTFRQRHETKGHGRS